jgi:DNA invertase Pin-like site-specific DNA recombinase
MGEKKMRAAIYARVSTVEQNPEAQLQELRAYVEKRKKKRKPRDLAYQELMDDAQKRLIDCALFGSMTALRAL